MATPRVPLPPEPVPAPCAPGGDIACFREELGPTAGRALAALARAVDAWVRRAPAARADVDPECIPELSLTLQALARLSRDRSHDAATAEAVGFGCYNLAEWAEERGAIRSALQWAQRAIIAWPQHPQYAYLIGRLARRAAEYEHAEHWLRYAMRLSRRRGDWETYAFALSGFGNVRRQRGNFPAAARFHRLTLKVARRQGLRRVEGDALHDLAVLAMDMGDISGALNYGREAIRAYGPGHSKIQRVAHDFAWLMMTSTGDFYHAAFILRSILPHIWNPPTRLTVAASLCRAAAGAGWNAEFESAWVDSWVLVHTMRSTEHHASSLLQMSYAAASAGSWERARMAAEKAIVAASERTEGLEIIQAETILSVLADPGATEAALCEVFPDLRFAHRRNRPARHQQAAERFIEDLSTALRAHKEDDSSPMCAR